MVSKQYGAAKGENDENDKYESMSDDRRNHKRKMNDVTSTNATSAGEGNKADKTQSKMHKDDFQGNTMRKWLA